MKTFPRDFYRNSSYTCCGNFAMGRDEIPLNYVAIITLLLKSSKKASPLCIGPQSALSISTPPRLKCPSVRWAKSV